MNDGDIDDILKQAANGKPDVDPVVLDRISRSLGSSLHPVRPLPPSWMLEAGLVGVSGGVAVAGGLMLGLHGLQKMTALEAGLIFPVLGIWTWLAAALAFAQVIPGSRRPVAPWLLVISGCLALAAVFALLFHDYHTEHFVPQGLRCLTAGLANAMPAYLAAWWLLSRGVALNPVAAGIAKGALAGLAGVTMLELHCANFEAPHVMVWHIAVIPISGAVGAVLARATRTGSRLPVPPTAVL